MIGNFKAAFLAHGLHFADKLADKTFFNKLRRERRFQRHGYAAVALTSVAFRLRHRDLDVLRQELNCAGR